ncbi:MAG: hypothetical protein K8R28_07740 [Desulfobacterales bacterium]|jgi:hypothetical protein|nr:hypothetical protein [Desulfobacterales bacterium]
MAIYGPDSETKLIARDDDSGTGWMQKLSQTFHLVCTMSALNITTVKGEQVHTALKW